MKPMQKSIVLATVLLAAVMASGLSAQQRKTDTTLPPVQSPPGLDDPGSKAVALPTPQQEAKSAVVDTQANTTAKQADNSGMPADIQAEANAAELPVVTVRQQGTDTVEEYRKHGKLVFVRVISDNGPARYYVDNPSDVPRSMQQLSGPSGVVQPVYYKLFEWK